MTKRTGGVLAGAGAAAPLLALFFAPLSVMLAFSFFHRVTGGFYEPAFEADNYRRLLSPFFAKSLGFSVWICGLAAAISVAVAFPLALAICAMGRKARIIWLILLLSALSLSEVVVGFSWSTLLSRTAGVGNMLAFAGLISEPRAFTPGFASLLTGLVFICVPFAALALLPPLARMPREWSEAALLMGATPVRTFLDIVLPAQKSAILAALIFSFVFALGSYALPILLGKPQHWTMSVLITDQALYQSNWPLAAALAVILTLACLCMAALATAVARK